MDGKWKISAAVGENGRTEKKAISFAAKYLSDDIKVLSGQKQAISNGLKM